MKGSIGCPTKIVTPVPHMWELAKKAARRGICAAPLRSRLRRRVCGALTIYHEGWNDFGVFGDIPYLTAISAVGKHISAKVRNPKST